MRRWGPLLAVLASPLCAAPVRKLREARYYTTLALHEQGGARWSKWFGGLEKALRAGQRADGAAAGSWDPLGTYSSSAGRVFITGLCALMLQTPYRYPRTR